MENYHHLLRALINVGRYKDDRTNTGTYSLFGKQLRFDMDNGFPLLTTKKIHWKSVVHELLWFISGDTNVKYLQENGVRIWNEWADENGDLGPIYGKKWRDWYGVDQLARAIDMLRWNPDSRRIIVSAWDPSVLPELGLTFAENVADGNAALPPCHAFFQFYTYPGPGGRKLSLHLYQRSADVFLGVPFNIASYALLLHMVAQVTMLIPDELVISFGDVHLYRNHLDQATLQLGRKHKHLPSLYLNEEIREIDDFKFQDIKLVGYDPDPGIKAQVAV